ncbi:MAG: autotransporter outer membrane beta-barrel domain-containing protein [Candidatus Competibacteraceae bacterium]|nr:autotransporter outer membrane beta-barrel domain-containing protein [Candidatus Competibacteraceae bacterium]
MIRKPISIIHAAIVHRFQRLCPGRYLPWFGMALTLTAGPTVAQETTLGSFGRTQLQIDTGDAVQRVCGGFARQEVIADTPAKRDLFAVCRSMVHTANELADSQGATRDSLGITAEALAFALQQVASEETIAPATALTDTSFGQLNQVFSRLVALRGGAAGLSLGSLDIEFGGERVNLAQLLDTGGGAGDGNDWGRLGAFINGHLGFGEVDATDRQDGFDYDLQAIVAGADYRLSDQAVLGAAVSYSNLDSDFEQSSTVAGGGVEADGYSLSLYGTWYRDEIYLSGVLGYGRTDFDLERRIIIPSQTMVAGVDRTARSETDSDQWLLSLSAGYEQNDGALTYGPYLRVDYLDAEIDGYNEQGALGLNLTVDDFEVESLVGTLGGRFSYAISRSFGVVVPQARVEWHHEFQNDSQTIEARYLNDPQNILLAVETENPDRNYFSLGLGVSGVFPNGLQAFADYEATVGQEDVEDHLVTAGVRWEF